MRILLVGEFSRLHNSLKEGLVALGHEVVIVASGDDFKNYPVDLPIAAKTIRSSSFLRFLNKITIKIFSTHIEGYEKAIRFYRLLPRLRNFDVVQLINSDALECPAKIQLWLYKKLFAQNAHKFLLICGDETPITNVLLRNNLKYSVFTPYFENPEYKKYYRYSLQFIKSAHRKLFEFIKSDCKRIFVSDLDYKIPMEQTGIPNIFIPNPINTDMIQSIGNKITDKINIFHGINKYSFVKKGNHFFTEALAAIREKYPEKVNIVTINSIPYEKYIKYTDEAHIVLDQVYSFDQGYNALEAMAKGKVVFTGVETEFYDYFNLTEKVAINALPDVDYLVRELSYLIENPDEITAIGKRARDFIEKEHDYIRIAEKYITAWK
jgi:glycosyltransferase involved in cell wall biosynthesis